MLTLVLPSASFPVSATNPMMGFQLDSSVKSPVLSLYLRRPGVSGPTLDAYVYSPHKLVGSSCCSWTSTQGRYDNGGWYAEKCCIQGLIVMCGVAEQLLRLFSFAALQCLSYFSGYPWWVPWSRWSTDASRLLILFDEFRDSNLTSLKVLLSATVG